MLHGLETSPVAIGLRFALLGGLYFLLRDKFRSGWWVFSIVTGAALIAMWMSVLGSEMGDLVAPLDAPSTSAGEPPPAPAPMVLRQSHEPPQAFTSASGPEEASKIRQALETRRVGAGAWAIKWYTQPSRSLIAASHFYFLWDTWVFIPLYALAFLSVAAWGRGHCLESRFKASPLVWIAKFMPFTVAVTVLGDWVENCFCEVMLDGSIARSTVFLGFCGTCTKVTGIVLSFFLLLGLGFIGLRLNWYLFRRIFEFAMRTRFAVCIGSVIALAFILVPHGRDALRMLISAPYEVEHPDPTVDWERLGWLLCAALNVSSEAWAWSRLLLGIKLGSTPSTEAVDDAAQFTENRLRRDLPSLLGGFPMIAIGSAFALLSLDQWGGLTMTIASLASAVVLIPFVLLIAWPLIAIFRGALIKPARPGLWPRMGVHAQFLFFLFFSVGVLVVVGHGDDSAQSGVPAAWMSVACTAAAYFLFGFNLSIFAVVLPAVYLVTAWHYGQSFSSVCFPTALMFLSLLTLRWTLVFRDIDEALLVEDPERFSTLTGIVEGTWAAWRRLFKAGSLKDDFARWVVKDMSIRKRGTIAAPLPQRPGEAAFEALLRRLSFTTVAQVILLAVFSFWPVPISTFLGSAAVLCLGASAWMAFGSTLVFFTQAFRVPVLTCAFLWVVAASFMADTHKVRLCKEAPKTPKVFHNEDRPVGRSFQEWLEVQERNDPGLQHPCIIVAAEGGGSRAAFWTGTLLAALQEASESHPYGHDFTSQVFAMSGVSGGSLGLVDFSAALAMQPASANLRGPHDRPGPRGSFTLHQRLAQVLGADYLAPVIGAFLYSDTLNRFAPIPWLVDRADALEMSWENSWSRLPGEEGSQQLQRPFLELRNNSENRWIPHLFLNGTEVETGKRIITSDLPIIGGRGGEFIDAFDAHLSCLQPSRTDPSRDVRLSTAALLSARFPYVSPPGRLPNQSRIVDGGYFEASAGCTGLEVLNAASLWCDKLIDAGEDASGISATAGLVGRSAETDKTIALGEAAKRVSFIFVFCRSADPGNEHRPAISDIPWVPGEKGQLQSQEILHPSSGFNESLGPVITLFKTRGARGTFSQEAVSYRSAGSIPESGLTVLSFEYVDKSGEIPVSWALSGQAAKFMIEQLPDTSAGPEPIDYRKRGTQLDTKPSDPDLKDMRQREAHEQRVQRWKNDRNLGALLDLLK